MKTIRVILATAIALISLFSCQKDDPELSSDKTITSFSFRAIDNPGLSSDVQGTFTSDLIQFTLPTGVSLTALKPTIILPSGISISPASGVPVDFTNPVDYTVTAKDKSTKIYTISVTATLPVLSSDKSITSFSFLKTDNPTLSEDVQGTISGQNIICTVPAGISVIALKPTIVHTGSTINPVSGIANNFTSPATYTVMAEDGSSLEYNATVLVSEEGPVVYVAGGQPFFGTNHARIWKNGVGTSITNGTYNTSLSSIFVSGNTVYVAGNQSIGRSIASYWVFENGVQLPTPSLQETVNDSYANSIYVDANKNIYVAGQENHGASVGHIAKVWKNGTATHLTSGFGAANSVFVSGDNVYVAGWEQTTTGTYAKVWKNGIETILNTEDQLSYAEAVFVSDGVVYVAGRYYNGSKYIVKVWKNGVEEEIEPESTSAEPTSIFVDNGNVYVTGRQVIDGFYKAVLWKNGSGTVLPSSRTSEAKSVYVYHGDVYVAGWETNSDNKLVAMLWKNGVGTPLATEAFVSSVFVK